MEEAGLRAKSIVGVATGTAAFIGETEKVPVNPQLITGVYEYKEIYGSVLKGKQYMRDAVHAFFKNGGTQCVVGRIVPEAGGAPTAADFEGAVDNEGNSSGLVGLMSSEFDDTTAINAPAASDKVVNAVIKHCENIRFRFAVLIRPWMFRSPRVWIHATLSILVLRLSIIPG